METLEQLVHIIIDWDIFYFLIIEYRDILTIFLKIANAAMNFKP